MPTYLSEGCLNFVTDATCETIRSQNVLFLFYTMESQIANLGFLMCSACISGRVASSFTQDIVLMMGQAYEIHDGRYAHSQGTQRANESRTGRGHKAGNASSPTSPWDGLPLSPPPERPARHPRPGVHAKTEGDIRPWVLLAPSPRAELSARATSQIEIGILASQIGRQ